MMRILLFLATNLAVVLIASVTLSLFGFNGFMAANGVDLNLNQLLIFCAVFGFAGSLFSLFISKWMAKMSTSTQIITQPRTRHEQWLMQTVEQLSQEAGIKMPEVGIFPAYEANAFATGWNKNDALVAVSQGLLERFSPDEVKAVLAHEIGHIVHRHTTRMVVEQRDLHRHRRCMGALPAPRVQASAHAARLDRHGARTARRHQLCAQPLPARRRVPPRYTRPARRTRRQGA